MSRKYKIHDQEDLHFLSYSTVNWVDALTRASYKDIIVDSLRYCQDHKGLELYAWCIMSNHVHLIAKAAAGHKLQDIMRDHKKHTSKLIVDAIRNNGQESRSEWLLEHFINDDGSTQFWQRDLHPIWLRTPSVIDQKLNYLHMNPVSDGIVAEAEHYLYSSAQCYAGLPSMLNLMLL